MNQAFYAHMNNKRKRKNKTKKPLHPEKGWGEREMRKGEILVFSPSVPSSFHWPQFHLGFKLSLLQSLPRPSA
jgi:hypothetical protein